MIKTFPEKSLEKVINSLINCEVMEKYLLVGWPEIQMFVEHPRWSECIFCTEIPGHPCPDSTYAVPESLYEEITNL